MAKGADWAPEESAKYKTGDILIGIAGRSKGKYDCQECKVVAVLKKHYKVQMLTGPAKGDTHKYYFNRVRSKDIVETETALLSQKPSINQLRRRKICRESTKTSLECLYCR